MLELHERLAWARRHCGFRTAAAAAKRFNWNLNTYKSHENGVRSFKSDTARAYARAFKINLAWLLTGEGEPVSKTRDLQASVGRSTVSLAPVRGETAAGRWLEFDEVELDSYPGVPVVPVRYETLEQFAFQVVGPSMDRKRIFDGDFVICVDYWMVRPALLTGDVVVVERKRGNTFERTCKEIVVKPDAFELWPRSTDARFQEPIVVPRADDLVETDGTSIEVIGLVVGRYTPMD